MSRDHIWIHSSVLDDYRLMTLPAAVRCDWFMLLLVAGRYGHDGKLPSLEETAWHLRIDEGVLEDSLDALMSAGIAHYDDGAFVIDQLSPTDAPPSVMRRRFQAKRDQHYRTLVERDGEYCRHCGTSNNLSVDHIHALANGGSNETDNLQLLCRSCNSRKGAR